MRTLHPGREAPPTPIPAGFRIDRRRFLKASLSAVGAYAALVSGVTFLIGPDKAWAVEFDAFDPDTAETLLSMTRALYPHERLGDVYYAKVVKDLDAEASGFEDQQTLDMFREGAAALDEAAGGDFRSATEDERQAALEGMAGTPFFQAVRGKAVVSLYNQPEVWMLFGYEGPSFQKGGYLYRGFDDLAWLPNPPAEASPPANG